MKLFSKWAEKEYSFLQILLAMLCAGILFLFLIPYLLIKIVPRLDATLGLPGFSPEIPGTIIGVLLMAGGFFFAWWSIYTQIALAQGTPLPIMPTQKLLVVGPFKFCRNPMTLGTILAYSGLGVLVGSISSIGVVLLFGSLLLMYIKFIEEKELADRFGQEYLDYKAATPFIIPRIIKR